MKSTTTEKNLRYERKYLVPFVLLDSIRNRIQSFVVPDKYGINDMVSYPEYTVRSIYLDTHNLDCHGEKLDGVELRKKFRIRTYNQQTRNSPATFEIKRKIDNRIKKLKAITQFYNVENLMQSCDVDTYFPCPRDNEYKANAHRFFYHFKKENMKPTVLVTYDREAYFGRFDAGVRITFDKNIRSLVYPSYLQMFTEIGLKHLFPTHFILEIKYFTDEMPSWAKSVVQDFRLRTDALSKYTIGYDVHFKSHIFNY